MGHREGVKKRYGVGMWKNRGRGVGYKERVGENEREG